MLKSIVRSPVLISKRQLTIPFLPTQPQKPGGVIGTPNDAYRFPPKSKMEGSYHWWMERTFTLTMLPLLTTAMLTSGPLSATCDTVFSLGVLGYSYMEFHSCITDYVSSRVYGKWHNYAMYLLRFGTVLSLFGIYKLENESDGVVGIVKKCWSDKKTTTEKIKGSV